MNVDPREDIKALASHQDENDACVYQGFLATASCRPSPLAGRPHPRIEAYCPETAVTRPGVAVAASAACAVEGYASTTRRDAIDWFDKASIDHHFPIHRGQGTRKPPVHWRGDVGRMARWRMIDRDGQDVEWTRWREMKQSTKNAHIETLRTITYGPDGTAGRPAGYISSSTGGAICGGVTQRFVRTCEVEVQTEVSLLQEMPDLTDEEAMKRMRLENMEREINKYQTGTAPEVRPQDLEYAIYEAMVDGGIEMVGGECGEESTPGSRFSVGGDAMKDTVIQGEAENVAVLKPSLAKGAEKKDLFLENTSFTPRRSGCAQSSESPSDWSRAKREGQMNLEANLGDIFDSGSFDKMAKRSRHSDSAVPQDTGYVCLSSPDMTFSC